MDIESVYKRNYARLVTYAKQQLYKFTGSSDGAEDVVQNVFLEICDRDLTHVNSIEAFLTRVTRNQCAQSARKMFRQRKAVSIFTDIVDSEGYTESTRKKNVLEKLIPMTGKPNSKILKLVYLCGLSQEKAAKEMDMSYPSFRMALSRARKKLKEVFDTVEGII